MLSGDLLSWPAGVSPIPLILLAVIALARLFPLPGAYHPLLLFRYLAQQLAAKVNPDPNRSRQQLLISGSLALLMLWLPLLLLLYSLYLFSEQPLLLDALLLYISLDWQNQRQQALQLQQQLQRGQLTLAREQSTTLLCRRTDNLSQMGLSKALLESLSLRYAIFVVGTCGYFLLGGGLAAFGYRLLQELQQQWSVKRQHFRYFGIPSAVMATVLSAPPKLLCALLLALQHGLRRSMALCRQPRLNLEACSYWLLCCSSAALKRSLGGPAYYNDSKLQRSKMLQPQQPAPQDIKRLIKQLRFTGGYFLLLLLSGYGLYFFALL